jgi:predicted PurR-regulated permease PerM
MQRIDISHKTIVFTVFFLIGIYALFLIRNVLILWFISFILMTALNPAVNKLERIKLPRGFAIFIIFILVGVVIGLILSSIIPPLIEQTTTLAKNLAVSLPESELFQFDANFFASQIELISKNAVNVLKIAVGAFSNLLTLFTLIVFTFYLLLERKKLSQYLKLAFGDGDQEKKAEELIDAIEVKLGGWVRGELVLMLIVGLLSYLGLVLLHIPYALPLALLAGLLELIPNIGPTISAIPAIIVASTISLPVALGVLALYLAVQQLENNIIVPMVMRKSVGINPLVTLMSLMIGLTLGGVAGAILAVPTFITAQIIIVHIFKYRGL